MSEVNQSGEVISPLLRILVIIAGILLVLNGLVMFLLPVWSAENFAWGITGFTAMTMGGWALGSAAHAWEILRHRRWSTVYPAFVYLAAFGVLEIIVILRHQAALRLNAALAWPYLIMLFAVAAAGLYGVTEYLRRRAGLAPTTDMPIPWWVRRILMVSFILFVGVLGVILFFGPERPGRAIFADPLTAFTAHAFGAFYLALALGVGFMAFERHFSPVLLYVRAGVALILFITAAALVYIGLFDFSGRPGGIFYVGTYFGGLFLAALVLLAAARRQRATQPANVEGGAA